MEGIDRDAAKHSTVQRGAPATKTYVAQTACSARVDLEHIVRLGGWCPIFSVYHQVGTFAMSSTGCYRQKLLGMNKLDKSCDLVSTIIPTF